MLKKLQKSFTRTAVLTVTLVMVLLCLIVNGASFITVDARLTDMLRLISENQGNIPPSFDQRPPREGRSGPYNAETPFSTRYFTVTFDSSGQLTDASLSRIAAVKEEDIDDYLAVAVDHGEGYGYMRGYKYRVLSVGEDENLAVFLDCYQEQNFVRTLALLSLLAVGLCAGLVYVLARLLSKMAVKPIAESTQRQKQFITDAGHELKTPITVITTSLSVLEMEVGQSRWIDKIRTQTDRLRELVNALVSLSRMDEEAPALTMAEFDLSAAAAETAESFRELAGERGCTLHEEIAPDISCTGDEFAVRQLCSVLLDNAIKYCSPAGEIRFGARREKRGVALWCENPCEPIDDGELEKLFDRFYRPDKSRSSLTGGFGVGLSLARSIAQSHHGSVSARCPSNGMIRFTATLKDK